MPLPSTRSLTLLTFLAVLLMAGCGSKPALISKSAAVPAGVDLTGFWIVRDNDAAVRAPQSDDRFDGINSTTRSQLSRRRRSESGASAQMFLQYGKSLKISQTDHGLFISYDRSVVEEYTFGENRLITIGPIEAIRVSGWEGSSFVVETLDDSRTILFETWKLENDHKILIRNIRIGKGEKDSFVYQQVFDRKK